MEKARLSSSIPRVFVVGHNKCGTRSIARLFSDNGYKALHWERNNIANQIRTNFYLSRPLLTGIEHANLYSDMESVAGPNSVKGHPFYAYKLYNLLDLQYPSSLFIYNYRNKKSWIRSRLNHAEGKYLAACRYHLESLDAPNCRVTTQEVIDWWERAWDSHEEEIFSYFKQKKNLIKFDIDSEESFRLLCSFLSKKGYQIKSNRLPKIE